MIIVAIFLLELFNQYFPAWTEFNIVCINELYFNRQPPLKTRNIAILPLIYYYFLERFSGENHYLVPSVQKVCARKHQVPSTYSYQHHSIFVLKKKQDSFFHERSLRAVDYNMSASFNILIVTSSRTSKLHIIFPTTHFPQSLFRILAVPLYDELLWRLIPCNIY